MVNDAETGMSGEGDDDGAGCDDPAAVDGDDPEEDCPVISKAPGGPSRCAMIIVAHAETATKSPDLSPHKHEAEYAKV